MPLRARSINFACTNNQIDLNRINQVSRIHQGNFYISSKSSAVGWNGLCWAADVHASSMVERRRYSGRAPTWPHSCPLLPAGTSTVNGKFTSEMFSGSQLKHGRGHIPRWSQACQYLMRIVTVYLRKEVGDWSSQFTTTKYWVIPKTRLVQETATSYIHVTGLKTYTVCVFQGTDWCRK